MSGVQFNLLPDVKLEFNRAQHAKRLVYTLAIITTSITLGLFIISFLTVDVLQKKLLDNAQKDITHYSNQLKSIPDLDKILTVQNQLNSLPDLHNKKHFVSRLFNYLPQITPTNAHIGKLDLDTGASTIQITGTADSVQTINQFVDTLKFTNYIIPNVSDKNGCDSSGGNWDDNNHVCTKPAFINVILSQVNRNEKLASYTINAGFDSNLFITSNNVTLQVPQEITTRSVINTPDTNSIFNGQTGTKNNQQGGQ